MSDPSDRAGLPPIPPGLPPELNPRGRGVPVQPSGATQPAGAHRADRTAAAGPRRRWRRVLAWVAVATSVAVLAVSALGYAAFRHYDGNIGRITDALPGGPRPAEAPEGALNILLVGSDVRTQSAAELRAANTTYVPGARSDTVMLLHVSRSRNSAQVVSFPRDAWVEIPEYTDGKGRTVAAHMAKLNSAFGDGGQSLLVQTIESLTDIRIDHYMQVDFRGFQRIVDALDGVEVCLSEPAKEKDSGIDLPAGRQVVRGEQALAFVRQRQELPNGDISRIERQQRFLGSIVREVTEAGTLLNPFKLNQLLDVATSSLQVDQSTSANDLRKLAVRMRHIGADAVTFTTLPVTAISARRGRESVVLLDDEGAEAVYDRIRQDVPAGSPVPAASAAAAEKLTVAPQSIRVRVYNGAGVAGLATTVSRDLRESGFVVVGSATNRGTGATATVVRYGPTRADSAKTLAAAITGAVLEADPELGSTLEVVAGSGYDGVRPVRVQSTSPSSPPGAATPPPVVTAASDPCSA